MMPGRSGPLRVGVVGADINHAFEYASVLHPPAPDAEAMTILAPLRSRMEDRMADIRWTAELTPERQYARGDIDEDPAFSDIQVVAWWGHEPGDAVRWAEKLGSGQVVTEPTEMLGEIDALLLCTFSADRHADLAVPFLEAGVPAFIDKPFASDVHAASTMIEAARRGNAVLFSSSPWKWSPAVLDLRARLGDLDGIRTVVATGPAVEDAYFYTVHTAELVYFLLGGGIEHVSCVSDDRRHFISALHRGGSTVVINGMKHVAWLRHLVVYGQRGYLTADITNEHRDAGKVRTMIEFVHAVRSGIPPIPLDELLEVTAFMAAAEQSSRHGGRPVPIAELLETSG